MEFILNNQFEENMPKVIDFNFEELKSELAEKLEKYNNLVVSEDSIKEAKADKANLNKLFKAIEDKRKEVKKQCLKPYEEFEQKVKELTTMIQQPVFAIDKQLKVFEDKVKQEKLDEITAFYKENIGELIEVLPMNKILNPKWENAACKVSDITSEMLQNITKVKNDFKIIEAMHLECEIQMKDAYLKNIDMSEALAEKNRFEEQQKRLEELKKAQTVKPPEQEEVKPIIEIQPINEVEISDKEELQQIDFRVWVTQEQKALMRDFFISNNIKYGSVK